MADEGGEDLLQKPLGILHAVEKVGGQNEIELSQGRQTKSVSSLKRDPVPNFFGRSLGDGCLS